MMVSVPCTGITNILEKHLPEATPPRLPGAQGMCSYSGYSNDSPGTWTEQKGSGEKISCALCVINYAPNLLSMVN